MKYSRYWAIMLILPLIFFYGGCQKKEEVQKPSERIMNVRAAVVEKKTFRPSLEAVGALFPLKEVIVSAEVDGIINKLHVEEGNNVTKGMVLAEIADRDYLLEVNRAEASVMQAEATLANTRLEMERKEALFKEELLTKQQFDDVTTRLALSQAELRRVQSSLSLARERQARTVIRSPLDGVVQEKKLNPGSFVRTAGQIFTLMRIDPIKLTFSIPEREIGKIKVGQEVRFQVTPFPRREFAGRISLIHPSLDEHTRTLRVEALAPNRERLLKPGLFANVVLYTGLAREMPAIPVGTIISEQEKHWVFVVDGRQAKRREVQPGMKQGEWIEITSGLSVQDNVVVAGQHNLIDGGKINVAR